LSRSKTERAARTREFRLVCRSTPNRFEIYLTTKRTKATKVSDTPFDFVLFVTFVVKICFWCCGCGSMRCRLAVDRGERAGLIVNLADEMNSAAYAKGRLYGKKWL
jgi:hypothetical protein